MPDRSREDAVSSQISQEDLEESISQIAGRRLLSLVKIRVLPLYVLAVVLVPWLFWQNHQLSNLQEPLPTSNIVVTSPPSQTVDPKVIERIIERKVVAVTSGLREEAGRCAQVAGDYETIQQDQQGLKRDVQKLLLQMQQVQSASGQILVQFQELKTAQAEAQQQRGIAAARVMVIEKLLRGEISDLDSRLARLQEDLSRLQADLGREKGRVDVMFTRPADPWRSSLEALQRRLEASELEQTRQQRQLEDLRRRALNSVPLREGASGVIPGLGLRVTLGRIREDQQVQVTVGDSGSEQIYSVPLGVTKEFRFQGRRLQVTVSRTIRNWFGSDLLHVTLEAP